MSTELVKMEIRESDLELVVTKKTLGHLTTNAKQIKEMVEAALPMYDIENYDENNIDLAKKDKAMLNNAAKRLNDRRIEIEREFSKPFQEFKEIVNETVKLISECSSRIDTVVKQSDEKARRKKREEIQKYWDSKDFSLVTLDKVFEAKWLNKTEKMKSIHAEIDGKITRINDDIKTLEAIGEDVELLKSIYLESLNINSTIQYANTLKQNRERAAAAEAERARREAQKKEEVEQLKNAAPADIPFADSNVSQPAIPFGPAQEDFYKPEILTRAFRVTTTRENIIALGDFMNAREIDFEKIEL